MISVSVKPAAPWIEKSYYLKAKQNSICPQLLLPCDPQMCSAKASMRSAPNLCQIPLQAV